jgi:hypothetical protein
MKELLLNNIKAKYSDELIQTIKYCRDEIRALKCAKIDIGYDEGQVEDMIGQELDKLYDAYFKEAKNEYNVTEREFDHIYEILEEL